MARSGNWSLLGLHGDPTPADPAVLQKIHQDMVELEDLAHEITSGLDRVLSQSNDRFIGKTAEAVRKKIDGHLKEFIDAIGESFGMAAPATLEYIQALQDAQAKVDQALTGAQGLEKDDPNLETFKSHAHEAQQEYEDAGLKYSRQLFDAASRMKQPVSGWDLFWKALGIVAIILSILGVIFGGWVGVLAMGLNAALMIKTAVSFAQGKASGLDLALSVIGMLFPSTRGLPIGTISKTIFNSVKNLPSAAARGLIGAGRGFAEVLSNPGLLRGIFTMSTVRGLVGTGLRAIAQIGLGIGRGVQWGYRAAVTSLRNDFHLATLHTTGTFGRIGVYAVSFGSRFLVSAVLPLNFFEMGLGVGRATGVALGTRLTSLRTWVGLEQPVMTGATRAGSLVGPSIGIHAPGAGVPGFGGLRLGLPGGLPGTVPLGLPGGSAGLTAVHGLGTAAGVGGLHDLSSVRAVQLGTGITPSSVADTMARVDVGAGAVEHLAAFDRATGFERTTSGLLAPAPFGSFDLGSVHAGSALGTVGSGPAHVGTSGIGSTLLGPLGSGGAHAGTAVSHLSDLHMRTRMDLTGSATGLSTALNDSVSSFRSAAGHVEDFQQLGISELKSIVDGDVSVVKMSVDGLTLRVGAHSGHPTALNLNPRTLSLTDQAGQQVVVAPEVRTALGLDDVGATTGRVPAGGAPSASTTGVVPPVADGPSLAAARTPDKLLTGPETGGSGAARSTGAGPRLAGDEMNPPRTGAGIDGAPGRLAEDHSLRSVTARGDRASVSAHETLDLAGRREVTGDTAGSPAPAVRDTPPTTAAGPADRIAVRPSPQPHRGSAPGSGVGTRVPMSRTETITGGTGGRIGAERLALWNAYERVSADAAQAERTLKELGGAPDTPSGTLDQAAARMNLEQAVLEVDLARQEVSKAGLDVASVESRLDQLYGTATNRPPSAGPAPVAERHAGTTGPGGDPVPVARDTHEAVPPGGAGERTPGTPPVSGASHAAPDGPHGGVRELSRAEALRLEVNSVLAKRGASSLDDGEITALHEQLVRENTIVPSTNIRDAADKIATRAQGQPVPRLPGGAGGNFRKDIRSHAPQVITLEDNFKAVRAEVNMALTEEWATPLNFHEFSRRYHGGGFDPLMETDRIVDEIAKDAIDGARARGEALPAGHDALSGSYLHELTKKVNQASQRIAPGSEPMSTDEVRRLYDPWNRGTYRPSPDEMAGRKIAQKWELTEPGGPMMSVSEKVAEELRTAHLSRFTIYNTFVDMPMTNASMTLSEVLDRYLAEIKATHLRGEIEITSDSDRIFHSLNWGAQPFSFSFRMSDGRTLSNQVWLFLVSEQRYRPTSLEPPFRWLVPTEVWEARPGAAAPASGQGADIRALDAPGHEPVPSTSSVPFHGADVPPHTDRAFGADNWAAGRAQLVTDGIGGPLGDARLAAWDRYEAASLEATRAEKALDDLTELGNGRGKARETDAQAAAEADVERAHREVDAARKHLDTFDMSAPAIQARLGRHTADTGADTHAATAPTESTQPARPSADAEFRTVRTERPEPLVRGERWTMRGQDGGTPRGSVYANAYERVSADAAQAERTLKELGGAPDTPSDTLDRAAARTNLEQAVLEVDLARQEVSKAGLDVASVESRLDQLYGTATNRPPSAGPAPVAERHAGTAGVASDPNPVATKATEPDDLRAHHIQHMVDKIRTDLGRDTGKPTQNAANLKAALAKYPNLTNEEIAHKLTGHRPTTHTGDPQHDTPRTPNPKTGPEPTTKTTTPDDLRAHHIQHMVDKIRTDLGRDTGKPTQNAANLKAALAKYPNLTNEEIAHKLTGHRPTTHTGDPQHDTPRTPNPKTGPEPTTKTTTPDDLRAHHIQHMVDKIRTDLGRDTGKPTQNAANLKAALAKYPNLTNEEIAHKLTGHRPTTHTGDNTLHKHEEVTLSQDNNFRGDAPSGAPQVIEVNLEATIAEITYKVNDALSKEWGPRVSFTEMEDFYKTGGFDPFADIDKIVKKVTRTFLRDARARGEAVPADQDALSGSYLDELTLRVNEGRRNIEPGFPPIGSDEIRRFYLERNETYWRPTPDEVAGYKIARQWEIREPDGPMMDVSLDVADTLRVSYQDKIGLHGSFVPLPVKSGSITLSRLLDLYLKEIRASHLRNQIKISTAPDRVFHLFHQGPGELLPFRFRMPDGTVMTESPRVLVVSSRVWGRSAEAPLVPFHWLLPAAATDDVRGGVRELPHSGVPRAEPDGIPADGRTPGISPAFGHGEGGPALDAPGFGSVPSTSRVPLPGAGVAPHTDWASGAGNWAAGRAQVVTDGIGGPLGDARLAAWDRYEAASLEATRAEKALDDLTELGNGRGKARETDAQAAAEADMERAHREVDAARKHLGTFGMSAPAIQARLERLAEPDSRIPTPSATDVHGAPIPAPAHGHTPPGPAPHASETGAREQIAIRHTASTGAGPHTATAPTEPTQPARPSADTEFRSVRTEHPEPLARGERWTMWGQDGDTPRSSVYAIENEALGLRGVYAPPAPGQELGVWHWHLPGESGSTAATPLRLPTPTPPTSGAAQARTTSHASPAPTSPVPAPALQHVPADVRAHVETALRDVPWSGGLRWRADTDDLYVFGPAAESPGAVFADGLRPRGDEVVHVAAHVGDRGAANSAWVTASRNVRLPRQEGPARDGAPSPVPEQPGWRYDVAAPGGVDVNETLDLASPHPERREVLYPGGVDSRYIRGVQRLDQGRPVGRYLVNPGFVEPRGTIMERKGTPG